MSFVGCFIFVKRMPCRIGMLFLASKLVSTYLHRNYSGAYILLTAVQIELWAYLATHTYYFMQRHHYIYSNCENCAHMKRVCSDYIVQCIWKGLKITHTLCKTSHTHTQQLVGFHNEIHFLKPYLNYWELRSSKSWEYPI